MPLSNQRLKIIIIGILSILVVFFLPFGYHVDLGPGPDGLISMVWDVPLEPSWYTIRFFIAFQYLFAYCFFRLFFLLEIFLFFIGKFNKIRFILVGVISEIIPLMISIPALFILNSEGENLIHIIWPLPFLLIFDILLVLLIKREKL
ncbi:MAG: hypothetical protein ACW98X_13780 [Promethearchaeota archaeon]|jgi:hypothetical protein